MAEDLDLQLDAAYQPLIHAEAVLRKRGQRDEDSELTALSAQIWSVVEVLQNLKAAVEAAGLDTARLDFLGKRYEAIAAGQLPNDFVVADEDGMVDVLKRGVPIRAAVDEAMRRPYFAEPVE